ncbi:glycosyltransferase family 2 protein [Turicibacter bilis]|uniref:glycosyltransferase family 2 protein n=1 Tax=Turicibacter bilis TaxID=2735723 RepID=UPI0031BB1FA4
MTIFSIIIPIYNVEKYLTECIESVLNQSFKSFEVILVNDGSTDSSGVMCDQYKDYPNVKVIHKENGGLSDARNCGIKTATGQYLIFIDSDDYWNSNHALDNLYQQIERNKDVDVVMYKQISYYMKKEKFIPNPNFYDLDCIQNHAANEVIPYLIESNNFSATAWSVAVKRTLILEHQIYFEKGIKSEDIDWSFHLFLYAKSFAATNERFLIYRKERPESITNTIELKNAQDLLFIIDKWCNYLKVNTVNQRIKQAYYNYLAYQYLILTSLVGGLSAADKKQIYKQFAEYSWLLCYHSNRKMHVIYWIKRVFGMKFTTFLVGKYAVCKE